MPTRRDFIKTSGLAIAGLSLQGFNLPVIMKGNNYVSKRPALNERKFVSEAVEKKINEVKKDIKNEKLAWMFENCYPNTLDTTVNFQVVDGKPDTFVITGDINAMWLRDSSAQVWPYLPLAKNDDKLKNLLAGVINRQTKCILIDPYANAFNYGPTGSEWDKDFTVMKPELHERKWELDSLCYPIRLAFNYWKTTGDTSCFDDRWQSAMKLILQTFKQQQRKDGHGPYKFQRRTAVQSDTVAGGGYGNPIKPVGLICSIFRPSDDSTIFPFYVPSNYFAVVSLRQLSEIFIKIIGDKDFAHQCSALADEVEQTLKIYSLTHHLKFGEMIAYEVDGFGNQLFMDDPSFPGLLSLPYFDCLSQTNPVYQNTRRFALSESNPYFFKGKFGEGIGSPHTGLGKIWPLSLIMQALTSDKDEEISSCLKTLMETDADTGFIHESFNKDNPTKFSRKWFAWANTLFGELILKIHKEKPYLLKA
ncbi:MAG: glycoside hydrolase family 125 protein [Bacteroidetes bacterium]|nr:glycoside hydrolase family 125 protein [Bacteroidota bacterium]